MTAGHSSYDDLAGDRRDSAKYREGYAEAQRAFLIGQAVRERRLALGLSQTELAARAGMTQPALSRLEAGGVIPTIRCWIGSPEPWMPISSSRSHPTRPETRPTLRNRPRPRAQRLPAVGVLPNVQT